MAIQNTIRQNSISFEILESSVLLQHSRNIASERAHANSMPR